MPSRFKKVLHLLTGEDTSLDFLKMPKKIKPLKKMTERQLLALESKVGGTLFGKVPFGHRRDFFCLDEQTWIWYEEWLDDSRRRQMMTVRYEISAQGVLKIQEGGRYSYLEGEELKNFGLSVYYYYQRVSREVYRLDPVTRQPLVA